MPRGERNRAKTHCPRGHAYVEGNLYFDKLGRRRCRTCILGGQKARYKPRQRPREKSPYCRNGHLYDAENTYRNAKGTRICRACNRLRVARIAKEQGRPSAAGKAWKVRGQARREARKRALPSTLTAEQWQAQIERQRGRCFYCGRQARLTQDHVISLKEGGADSAENVVGACRSCNSAKGPRRWLLC